MATNKRKKKVQQGEPKRTKRLTGKNETPRCALPLPTLGCTSSEPPSEDERVVQATQNTRDVVRDHTPFIVTDDMIDVGLDDPITLTPADPSSEDEDTEFVKGGGQDKADGPGSTEDEDTEFVKGGGQDKANGPGSTKGEKAGGHHKAKGKEPTNGAFGRSQHEADEAAQTRNRWSDDRNLELVKHVSEFLPQVSGISNKERAKRWNDVCKELTKSVLFQGGVSVEAAKQQLRRLVKEGNIAERKDRSATGEGEAGQYSPLQRALIDLQQLVAAHDSLDMKNTASKLTAGQRVREMMEKGRGESSTVPGDRSESPDFLATPLHMAGSAQDVRSMQGQLNSIAKTIASKKASSSYSAREEINILVNELREGREASNGVFQTMAKQMEHQMELQHGTMTALLNMLGHFLPKQTP